MRRSVSNPSGGWRTEVGVRVQVKDRETHLFFNHHLFVGVLFVGVSFDPEGGRALKPARDRIAVHGKHTEEERKKKRASVETLILIKFFLQPCIVFVYEVSPSPPRRPPSLLLPPRQLGPGRDHPSEGLQRR